MAQLNVNENDLVIVVEAPSSGKSKIYVGSEQVGLIEDLSLHLSRDSWVPEVTVIMAEGIKQAPLTSVDRIKALFSKINPFVRVFFP